MQRLRQGTQAAQRQLLRVLFVRLSAVSTCPRGARLHALLILNGANVIGAGSGIPWRRLRVAPFSDSLRGKFESVLCERVAEDAGNPSGTRHFAISTALGDKRGENNEHKYAEARP